MFVKKSAIIFAAGFMVSDVNAQQVQHEKESAVDAAPAKGAHGGSLQKVGSLMVETIVEVGGLKLFAYDPQGNPLDLSSARGLVTIKIPGGAKKYRYDLFPELLQDKSAESLAAAVDLSKFTGQQVELAIQLMGFPQGTKRPAEFTASVLVPLTEAQQVAAEIAAQGVCPVSGGKLGSMGKAIAVPIGNKTIYVCCAGCVDAVKEHPEKYLNAKPKLTVDPVTDADAAAIALQKICPVMDEPLDGMGGPYKTVVEGRVVYLCCPGCAKKLHADPAPYFAKLAKQGVVPPIAR